MTPDSLGPYRLVSKIGAGGMGEVFLADDPRLGRRVAIKRCGGITTPDARERLRREARAAAGLSHPHIATIYDVIETAEGPHVVMEFVEGETLASVLRRGPLSVPRAVQLGSELAGALAAAHAAGVVHRDLKPGNVMMMPDGHAKVLDFGLAKLPAGTSPTADPLTGPGVWLGTPGYTAPEQLLGHGVDQRSDIYSLGAVLYEALAGRSPFGSRDALAVATAIATSEPPHVADLDPSVPRELDAIVHRAMARDPADRPANAAEVRQALDSIATQLSSAPTSAVPLVRPRHSRRTALAVLTIAIAAIVGVLAYRGLRGGRGAPAGAKPRGAPVIAVLPFESLTGRNDSYIASGFQDSLITDLSGLPQLTVLSRAALKEANPPPDEPVKAARVVGATYVVNGSVQSAGGLFRVNLQILDTQGRTAWSNSFEGSTDGLFDLQRAAAEGVIDGLQVAVPQQDRSKISRPRAANVAAASAFWRGRDLLDRDTPTSATEAIAAFEEAIAADARFAGAYAALTEADWARYTQTKDPEWVTRALGASDQALKLDPRQPQVWVSRAQVHHGVGRSDEALADLDRALEINPRSDDALRFRGRVLGDVGRADDAVAAIRQAIAIRPEYWRNYDTLGRTYFRGARWPEAIDAWKKVIELQPDSARAYMNIGVSFQRMGDKDRALSYFRDSIARAPTPEGLSAMGYMQYERGDYRAAADSFARAVQLSPRNAMLHRNLGDAWRRLGDARQARAAYEQAVALSREDLRVNPQDAVSRARLAVYLAKLGSAADARREIARALETAPNNGDVRYRAAVVDSLLGLVDPALAQLRQAVSLGYSAAAARDDDDLAPLRKTPEFARITAGPAPAGGRTP